MRVDTAPSQTLPPRPAGSLHRFANPGRFLRLTEAWLPWLTVAALMVLGAGWSIRMPRESAPAGRSKDEPAPAE